MSQDSPEVTAARIEAERARGQLMDTVHALQARLSPSNIASNAWSDAKTKGADLAGQAAGVARERPGMVGAVIGAVTLFLAREPLRDLAGGLKDKVTYKRGATKSTRKSQPTDKKTETINE